MPFRRLAAFVASLAPLGGPAMAETPPAVVRPEQAEIAAPDAERAGRWFERNLGFVPCGHGVMEGLGYSFRLIEAPVTTARFETDDLAALVRNLEAGLDLSVTHRASPEAPWIAVSIAGPDGLSVEVFERVDRWT